MIAAFGIYMWEDQQFVVGLITGLFGCWVGTLLSCVVGVRENEDGDDGL